MGVWLMGFEGDLRGLNIFAGSGVACIEFLWGFREGCGGFGFRGVKILVFWKFVV